MAFNLNPVRRPFDPGPPKSAGGGGGPAKGNITGTLGLNTTSKAPLDVFALPTTGQFNQEILNAAKRQYMPALNQVNQNVAAENATNRERNQYLGSVFGGYKDAVSANNEGTQNVIDQLQNQENGLNTTSNDVLNAAIGSAYGNANSLASLGLGQGANPQALAEYNAAANTSSQSDQQDLNAIAGNLVAAGNRQLNNVAGEKAQDLATQNANYRSDLGQLRMAKTGIIDDIPGIIDQTRNTLLTQLQASQNVRVQERLAEQEYGLKAGALADTTAVDQAKIGYDQGILGVDRTKAATEEQKANIAAESVQRGLAALSLSAQKQTDLRKQNALKYITTWITPRTQDYVNSERKTTTTNPKTGASSVGTTTLKVLSPTYHKNPAGLIAALEQQYGMNHHDALTLVANVNIPLSGGPNAQTLGQWASAQLRPKAVSYPQLSPNPPKGSHLKP